MSNRERSGLAFTSPLPLTFRTSPLQPARLHPARLTSTNYNVVRRCRKPRRSPHELIVSCSSTTPRPITPDSLPKSVGVAKDPITGAKILLVGCVHGSQASAQDVSSVLQNVQPDALVLELCSERLDALKRTMNTQSSTTNSDDNNVMNNPPKSTIISDKASYQAYSNAMRTYKQSQPNTRTSSNNKRTPFKRMVQTFGGVGPALLAYGLNFIYGLQKTIGVDPGTEFKTALRCVAPMHDNCVVVCGDAKATDTINSLVRTLDPIRTLYHMPWTISSLARRFLWPMKNHGAVSVPRVLWDGAGSRVREFLRVFAPLFAGLYFVGLLAPMAFLGLGSSTILSALGGPWHTIIPSVTDAAQAVASAWPVMESLISLYVTLSTLRFIHVLITERDAVIGRSIRDTARTLYGAQRSSREDVVIVAVVGLLHVNGILQWLNQNDGVTQ